MKKLLVINPRQDVVFTNRDGKIRTYRNASRAAQLVEQITDETLDIGKYLSGNIEVTNDLEFSIFDASQAAVTLGSLGGKSTSDAKRKASAKNGKLGGRPKKTQK